MRFGVLILGYGFLIILTLILTRKKHVCSFSNVPKIIHQTWESWDSIVEPCHDVIERMKARNPDFEYRFYSADDRKQVVEHYSARALKAYESLKIPAMQADLFRYCVLYLHGGVYLDIKSEVTEHLSDLIAQHKGQLMYGVWPHPPPSHKNHARTSFLVWPKRHDVMKKLIEKSIQNVENRDSSWVSFVTGPDVYAKVVNDNVPASCIDFSYDMFGQKLNHDGTGGKYYDIIKADGLHWSQNVTDMYV